MGGVTGGIGSRGHFCVRKSTCKKRRELAAIACFGCVLVECLVRADHTTEVLMMQFLYLDGI